MRYTWFYPLLGSHDECIVGRWPGWQNPVTDEHLWWGRGRVGWFGENNPGLRYRIHLPDYTCIEKVRLHIHTSHERWFDLRHRLFGRKCLDAPAWTSRADYLAAPLTTAYWQGNLLPWKTDGEYNFDITDIFMEIINQPGWASENFIALLFHGPLTNATNRAAAFSYAGDSTKAALLALTWLKDDPPPAPPEPQPPPPKPNPPIPGGRFAITDLVKCFQGTNAILTALSDVTCHLWLRWTGIQPERHKVMTERRGRPWYVDIKNCFVQFEDIEQLEPGDSNKHTFVWPGWVYCTERWYHFHGTIAGEPSPSNTAYWSLHLGDLYTGLVSEPWTWLYVPPPALAKYVTEYWSI